MANKQDLFVGNKPVGHVSRNGFDNSQDLIFSMRPSVARPVYFLETVPDSAHKIDAVDLVRTNSLQTAAFLRGKQELDFFFVPYSLLDSQANNIILTRGDTVNPVLTSKTVFHSVNLAWLVDMASLPYIFMRAWRANVGNNSTNSPLFFTSFLNSFVHGYLGVNYSIDGDDLEVVQRFSRMFIYDVSPFVFNGDTGVQLVGTLNFVGADSLSLLASLGYGDYFQYFDLVLTRFFHDNRFSDDMAEASEIFLDLRSDVLTYILDPLGSGVYQNDFKGTVSVTSAPFVNLLPLAAYQKIFHDYYRDSVNDENPVYDYASTLDWLTNNNTQIYPLFSNNGAEFVADNYNVLLTFLRPHTRMYKKDLSCGLYSSTQYGAFASSSAPKTDYVAVEAGANSTPSAASLKFAFALQRYRQMLLRAGSRTKDVLRAEFGVRSQYIDEHYCRYLGSFQGSLDVNRVSATAESGDYSVGDIAGNVFSSLQGKTIDFTCNDYGIVIGVLSFLSDPVHNAYGFERSVQRVDTADFPHPEFDNLGLMPVSSHSFSVLRDSGQRFSSDSPLTLGFAPRDIEYKQKFDKAFENFSTSPLLSVGFVNLYEQSFGITPPDGVDSNYVITKPTSQDVSLLVNRIYQLPNVMDSIFTVLDSGEPADSHFKVCLSVHCTSVNPMSVLGLV